MATALLTAEAFWQMGPETDGFELVRGELLPMPPPGDQHGVVCVNASFMLKTYTKRIGRGIVVSNDTGIVTERNPDTVRGVDVALFLDPRWPDGKVPEGYSALPPDLAVEIRSPHQSWREILAKVHEYLDVGVRVVWVVDPRTRRVTIFSPDQEPSTLAAENDLDGGDVLPGFSCKVAEFFEGLT